MSALRSKKALEEILDRRIGAAEQLRGVVRSIDQAKGDVEVG
jgi:charged multivesicular body protein 7